MAAAKSSIWRCSAAERKPSRRASPSGLQIGFGVSLFVSSGATAVDTTVTWGEIVYGGGIISGVGAGRLDALSEGVASGVTVNGLDVAGFILIVSSGATALNTVVNGGRLLCNNGGTISGTKITTGEIDIGKEPSSAG